MKIFVGSSALLFALMLSGLTACESEEAVKKKQFIYAGLTLYRQRCQNCHGAEGVGLGRLYPPLAKSDYLQNTAKVACGIRNGMNGEMKVNGVMYKGQMPAQTDLTDGEIAQLLTYLHNDWGNDGASFRREDVAPLLEKCK
jgi:cytochrome c551